MKTNVREYTDIELIKRVEQLPTFKGWVVGKYGFLVRSSEDEYNKFDDKFYNFEVFKNGEKPKFHSVDSGTTNAGAAGLKDYKKYNTLGCAILKADTIIYGSHTHGISKGKIAYRQAKPWPYFRDNDKDNKAEEIGKEYNDIIQAHQHRAGVASQNIDNWSVACLVRNVEQEFKDWLVWMNKLPVNTAILKEW
jgi:hypothetical protein